MSEDGAEKDGKSPSRAAFKQGGGQDPWVLSSMGGVADYRLRFMKDSRQAIDEEAKEAGGATFQGVDKANDEIKADGGPGGESAGMANPAASDPDSPVGLGLEITPGQEKQEQEADPVPPRPSTEDQVFDRDRKAAQNPENKDRIKRAFKRSSFAVDGKIESIVKKFFDLAGVNVGRDFAALGGVINNHHHNMGGGRPAFCDVNFVDADTLVAARVYAAEVEVLKGQFEADDWVHVDMGDHSASFALLGAVLGMPSENLKSYQVDIHRGENIRGPIDTLSADMLGDDIADAYLFVKAHGDVFNIPIDTAARSALQNKLRGKRCRMFISTHDDRPHRHRVGPRDAANFYIAKRYYDHQGLDEGLVNCRQAVASQAIFRDLPRIEAGLADCADFGLFMKWLQGSPASPPPLPAPEASPASVNAEPSTPDALTESAALPPAESALRAAEMRGRASIIDILEFLAYHFPNLDLMRFNTLLDRLAAQMDKLQPLQAMWHHVDGQTRVAEIFRSQLLRLERDALFGKARLTTGADPAFGGLVVSFQRDAHGSAVAARMAANPNLRQLLLDEALRVLLPEPQVDEPCPLTVDGRLENLTAALLVTTSKFYPAMTEPYLSRFVLSGQSNEAMQRYERLCLLLRDEPGGDRLLSVMDRELQTHPLGGLLALRLVALQQSRDLNWLEPALQNSWNRRDEGVSAMLQWGLQNIYLEYPDRWLFVLDALLGILEQSKLDAAKNMAGVLLNDFFVWADIMPDIGQGRVHPLWFLLMTSTGDQHVGLAARLVRHWLNLPPAYGISHEDWEEGEVGSALVALTLLLRPQLVAAPVESVIDAIPATRTIFRLTVLLVQAMQVDTKERPHPALALAVAISKTIGDLYPGMSTRAMRSRQDMRDQIIALVREQLENERADAKFSAYVEQVCAKLKR